MGTGVEPAGKVVDGDKGGNGNDEIQARKTPSLRSKTLLSSMRRRRSPKVSAATTPMAG